MKRDPKNKIAAISTGLERRLRRDFAYKQEKAMKDMSKKELSQILQLSLTTCKQKLKTHD